MSLVIRLPQSLGTWGGRERLDRALRDAKKRRGLRRSAVRILHRCSVCLLRVARIISEIDWEKGKESRHFWLYAKKIISKWNLQWLWPEPGALRNTAIERCLSGERRIHRPTRESFEQLFCYVMLSIVRGEKKKADRHGEEALVEESRDEEDEPRVRHSKIALLPIAEDQVVAENIADVFMDRIEDPKLKTYACNKRQHPDWKAEEHAHAMGIEDVQEIYRLERRLQHRRGLWFRLGGSPPPAPRPRRRQHA